MGEKQGVRANMTELRTRLVRNGMSQERAAKIATDTAMRVVHGEKHRTNFPNRRDRDK